MEPAFITVHGLRLAIYERPGDDVCLFFVHGNSSNARAFQDVWASESLSRYHLICIDLPGHGDSACSEDGTAYTMSSLGQLIAAVIALKDVKNVILVGHSIGGHIAISALNYTDALIGISLAGTAPVNSVHELPHAYILSGATEAIFKAETTEEETLAFSRSAVHKDEKMQAVIEAFKQTDKRFRHEVGLEIHRYFGSESFLSEIELLRGNNLPVCVIHGAEEKLVNLDQLGALDGLNLFQGKPHLIPDAGHGVPFESPEEYAQILANFVSGLSRVAA